MGISKGVYDFKKKWGANDMRYFYYTLLINKEIMTLSRDQLLELYPNFLHSSFLIN